MGQLSLSDAILLGAMLRPQARYRLFKDGKSCVYGAISEGAGFLHYTEGLKAFPSQIMSAWPLLRERGPCPECKDDMDRYDLLWHLNDTHEWSRERIAGLVRTWETPEQVAALPSGGEIRAGTPDEGGKVCDDSLSRVGACPRAEEGG